MVDIRRLRAEMAFNGFNQRMLAEALGLTEQTISKKMRTGKFGTEEVRRIVDLLSIRDPAAIFFTEFVTYEVTNSVKSVCLSSITYKKRQKHEK